MNKLSEKNRIFSTSLKNDAVSDFFPDKIVYLFMTKDILKSATLCLVIIAIFSCHKNTTAVATRSFYMGVTPWPADFTNAELDTAYAFINDHCDIVSQHFDDGIPYSEALNNLPMPSIFAQDVQSRKLKTPAGKKILLSVSALNLTRKAKADYYSNELIPDSTRTFWKQIAFNDPKTVTAYINYISFLIDQMQPDFVNYGVESNNALWDSAQFVTYKSFLSQVYGQLRTKYPSLPFFISFMVDESSQGLEYAKQLLPYTDYIGLSAYPYVTVSSSGSGNTDPSLFPAGYFERFINLDQRKPFLFAETGYIAEDLNLPSLPLNKHGTSSWQQAYLQIICNLCNSRQARMLIWFCSKDYDAGDSTLRALGKYNDIFGIWQNIGLKDKTGAGRPAYHNWLNWMAMKKN
jgi:hypothetical protein